MSILDAKYKIPDKARYSKKVSKLIKMMLHKEQTKRPTCKQISEHCVNIINGGKGTLSSKSKKQRSNSHMIEQTPLTLAPKQQNDSNRRKSWNVGGSKDEIKIDAVDEGWDPFEDEEEDPFDDPFSGDNFDNNFDNTFKFRYIIFLCV